MSPTARALAQRLEPFADPALALVVFGLSIQPLLSARDCGCDPAPTWGFLLVAAQCLPLAVRRRWPLPTTLASGLLSAAYGLSNLPDPPVYYAAIVGLYTVAALGSRRDATIAALVAVGSVAVVFILDWGNSDYQDYTVAVATFVTAFLLGQGARTRRERAAELEERATQLERTRAAEAQTAVVAERNRIARELHDSVAHHVSMMVVQAEAGPVAVGQQPDRAVEAFEAISIAGKQALIEMRQLLGVLKTEERGLREPQPGIDQVRDLVDGAAAAGLDVTLTVHGKSDPIPLSVSLAAYRVVQEALTNCVRHASSAHVDVLVEHGDAITIQVCDDGPNGLTHGWKEPPTHSGHGLLAMRERVTSVGGTLEAGPRADGGWRVKAVLPRGTESWV